MRQPFSKHDRLVDQF